MCRAGQFLVASKVLCGLTYDIGHSDSHMVLLKCLADAEEVPIAVEHVKQIGNTSRSMLQIIFTELLALLSSSKPEPIIHLLQALPERCIDFNNDTWKQICSKPFN